MAAAQASNTADDGQGDQSANGTGAHASSGSATPSGNSANLAMNFNSVLLYNCAAMSFQT